MKPGISLFAKIFIWFLFSFVLIGTVALIIFTIQNRTGSDFPLKGEAAKRMRATVHLIAEELANNPKGEWDKILNRWSDAYNVDFMLVSRDGERISGPEMQIPAKIKRRLKENPRFRAKTRLPARSWMAMPLRPGGPGGRDIQGGKPRPGMFGSRLGRGMILLISIDPSQGEGFFSESLPWLLITMTVVGLAFILWFPLVRNLTRPIGQMTDAAEEIAQGNFAVRVDENRGDEIGRLGGAINDMAGRLSNLVKGQKRFLGDVSHELRSPMTRIQVALELLEQSADEGQKKYIEDGLEEIRTMSALVGELLALARAEVNQSSVKLQLTDLAPIVNKIAQREGKGFARINVDVQDGIMVYADKDLLARAVSNLVRNAIRYAGEAGPIDIRARRVDSGIRIEIVDSGKGIPEKDISLIFDPFYRLETHRDRDTGGAGLGLAIVKTCIEACRGRVFATNLQPSGFMVTIVLSAEEDKNP